MIHAKRSTSPKPETANRGTGETAGELLELLELARAELRAGPATRARVLRVAVLENMRALLEEHARELALEEGLALACECPNPVPPMVDDPWAPGDTFTCRNCGAVGRVVPSHGARRTGGL